ncbi:MAG: hypothetical protein JWL59_1309 [Chthoniobacteraceae bacterium]|nr:hypothetical protein [Chthoniobacteraceae bacterium]
MEQFKNLASQIEELRAVAVPWPIKFDNDHAFNPAGTRAHDDDSIAHVDRFIDVVGDQNHGGLARPPEAQNFILHPHPGKGIEGAERLIEEEEFWMIDQCPRKGHALGHAAGKMMGKRIGERFKSHQPHEFINFMPLFTEQTARDQTDFDIAPYGQPREKIRVLENKAALGVGGRDYFRADTQFAGVR